MKTIGVFLCAGAVACGGRIDAPMPLGEVQQATVLPTQPPLPVGTGVFVLPNDVEVNIGNGQPSAFAFLPENTVQSGTPMFFGNLTGLITGFDGNTTPMALIPYNATPPQFGLYFAITLGDGAFCVSPNQPSASAPTIVAYSPGACDGWTFYAGYLQSQTGLCVQAGVINGGRTTALMGTCPGTPLLPIGFTAAFLTTNAGSAMFVQPVRYPGPFVQYILETTPCVSCTPIGGWPAQPDSALEQWSFALDTNLANYEGLIWNQNFGNSYIVIGPSHGGVGLSNAASIGGSVGVWDWAATTPAPGEAAITDSVGSWQYSDVSGSYVLLNSGGSEESSATQIMLR